MPRERPHAPRSVKQDAPRSHVAAARAARHLIAQVLAEPVPDGRRAVAAATQDARMALALLSLTLTYSKTSDRFRLVDVSEATGYPTRTCGRILARLHGRGWVDYKPASVRDRRAWCQVSLEAPVDDGRPDCVAAAPLLTVAFTGRRLICDVLATGPAVALCRVALSLISDFVTWLRVDGFVDRGALASSTKLDARTVGRKLAELQKLGVLGYTPGCGRGNRGVVSLAVVEPPAKEAAAPSGRADEAAPLGEHARAELNRCMHEVADILRLQDVRQGQQFYDAINEMSARQKFARQVSELLSNGHEVDVLRVLTEQKFPTAPSYAGATSVAGAICSRIEKLHAAKAGTFGYGGRVDTAAVVGRALANTLR